MKTLRDALYSTLRLIARHVEGYYAALAAFLTVGLLVAVMAVVVFAAVAGAVNAGLTQDMDEAALRWFAAHRSAILDQVAIEVTTLGTTIVLIMLVLVASVFLWQTQHKWSVYVLFMGTLGGAVLNNILKAFFHRPRPTIVAWAETVHSASFPSGHAMSSLIAYGSIAYLVGRLNPSPVLQRTIWLIAALLILAIGTSRVYLGVHFPSDVIAGFLAGLAWLTFVAATLKAIQFFADRRPETHQEEHDLRR